MHYRLVFYISCSLLLLASCSIRHNTDTYEDTKFDRLSQQLSVEIYDSMAFKIIDPDTRFEILASGFHWSEGPLWIDELQALLFSDVPANKIYKWNMEDSLSVYLESAGHSGEENKDSGYGPNGLILDRENKLVLCQHGDRRIARMDADLINPQALFTTIADNYDGKQFNSPNDLIMDRAGHIYFTDPPYGQAENKTGEIGINGVFRVNSDKKVILLIDSLTWPNGIALSLDQQTIFYQSI